jgi:RimJ/RimL family protein N-acetyltransferase
VAYFLAIDFVDHVALVALAEEDGKPPIVGGARYVVVRSGQAEVAFAVIDEYQGKGIGAAMMRALASIARQTGLRELIAEVLADNSAMLKVFEASGLKTRRAAIAISAITNRQRGGTLSWRYHWTWWFE